MPSQQFDLGWCQGWRGDDLGLKRPSLTPGCLPPGKEVYWFWAEGASVVLVFHSQIRLTRQIFPDDYRDGFGGET